MIIRFIKRFILSIKLAAYATKLHNQGIHDDDIKKKIKDIIDSSRPE